MTTNGWTAEVRERVDSRLRDFFLEKRAASTTFSPVGDELVDAIGTLTLRGGKRLRPTVLVAGYLAVSPSTDLGPTVDAAASLELLQTYLLIHDDWMDADDTRRGGPSVHAALRERHGDAHLGASLAILAGDLASAYAWELVASAQFPAGRLHEGLSAFLRMQEEVVFGQHLDMLGHEDAALVQHLKTGSYTVRGPLRLGAVIGNASPKQLEVLERFGAPLGLAFQLRDDLLGMFGDPQNVGKPVGNDLRSGKRTSLIEEAESRLSGEERQHMDSIRGRVDAPDSDIAKATELIVRCGARAEIERRLQSLVEEAHLALDGQLFSRAGLGLLHQVASMLAMRDR